MRTPLSVTGSVMGRVANVLMYLRAITRDLQPIGGQSKDQMSFFKFPGSLDKPGTRQGFELRYTGRVA